MSTAETIALRAQGANANQEESEFLALIEFLEQRPPPQTVLEIGTYQGGTLLAWCLLATDDALIVSIDLSPDSPLYDDPGVPGLVSHLREHGKPEQRMVFLRGDSHAPETRLDAAREFDGRGVDLLFIDADHSYDGALADWNDYGPMVRPGGVVIFHDIAPSTNPNVEVDRLWREIEGEKVEFVAGPGLGVVLV